MSSTRPPPAPAHASRFQTLAEELPGAWFRCELGREGRNRVTHMSAGCADLLEAPGQGEQASLRTLIDAEDVVGFHSALVASASHLTDWAYEWRITPPSGARKWLHGVGRPTRLADGSVAWNVFVIDITHTRPLDDSMRNNKTRFQQLLDSVANVSVQGYGTDLTTRYWNKASERLYGYTAQEAIGSNLLDLIIPQPMHEGVKAAVADMIRTGRSIPEGDLMLRRKDGTPIEVFSSHVYLDIPGSDPEFYCIDFDLSERRQSEALRALLESQLRESQKMEALGTLAGGVAHDFNNILAAIMGNVELGLSELEHGHPSRTSLFEIRKASRRARELIQQILSFSSRQTLQRRPMRVESIVEESMRLLRATLPAGTELNVSCEPHAPRVLADATQIEQVLLNLCTNAWQAVPPGRPGVITVQLHTHHGEPPHVNVAKLTHLGLAESAVDTWVCLSVSDNGDGMDQETRARIFEPFFTTKAPGKGTGLGLAVVHGILRDHQAVLDVRTAPGAGTTFAIYFPTQPLESDFQATAPAQLSSEFGALEGIPATETFGGHGNQHILYVDDDELITFLMQRLLQKKGYRVSVFVDAADALEAFSREPASFDLVISDYNMPGMSGLDVARAVKALSPHTPVAITSGYLHDTLRAEAPAAGVNELIYKPDSVEELFAAVDRLASAVAHKDC